jgi:Na+/melibiose symporter-like transporter
MRATPAGDQGSTAGTVQLCQTGFSSITPIVMFAVLAPTATVFPGGGVVYAESGFRTWLIIAAVMALVALVIGVTVLRERPDEEIDEFTRGAHPVPVEAAPAEAVPTESVPPAIPRV